MSQPDPTGVVVLRTGTGYLRTEVHDRGPGAPADARFRWVRRPGPQRPEPFREVPAGLLEVVGAAAGSAVRIGARTGASSGDGRVYDAPSAMSLAMVLSSGQAGAVAAHVDAVMRRLRAGLMSWEAAAPAAPGNLGPAPALDRLDRWLAGQPGPRASAEAAAAVTARLGEDRIGRVRAWCADLADGRTVVHGAFSSGSVVLPLRADAPPLVLAGEELARGRAGFDRGWLVGELDELEHHLVGAPAGSTDAALAVIRAARDVLLPLGTGDRDLVGVVERTRAVRVLVHLHDFAAYVGWHETLVGLAALAADRVDAVREGVDARTPQDAPNVLPSLSAASGCP